MAVITLLTDFGSEDYYSSVFKGELYKSCPSTTISDISHNIKPFDINLAAYLLKSIYSHYPEGSLHIARVHESSSKDKNILLVKHLQHFFAAPDNGLLSMVFDERPTEIYYLNKELCKDFSLDQMYAKIARTVVFNGSLGEIGILQKDYMERLLLKPVIYENRVSGNVMHIDHFGNVVTNISRTDFEQGVKGRRFEIYFRRFDKIDRLSENYSDVPEGDKLAHFNDNGYLEIAINVGEASTLLGLSLGDKILIQTV